jgi:methylmalonyl-CoA/ethylmalonyl-CoA epimerase
MKVHHVGYAVKNISEALTTFKELGFTIERSGYLDEKRKVWISLLLNGPYRIELIAPAAEGSPVDTILEKVGPCCYHLCYQSLDIESDILKLKAINFKVLLNIDDAPALGNAKVAFLFNKKIGLVELMQEFAS